MAETKNVPFRLFKTYTPDEQQISVVSMVDDTEFDGSLEEFCKKYGNRYDNCIVYDPREHNGIIVFELF